MRGSLSLEDCITDVIADPVEMAIAGETWGFQGKGKYAHGGFLSSALYIREELERSQVLTSVFGNGGGGKGNVPAAATAGGGNGAGGGTGAGGGKGVSSGDVESQGNPLHIPSSSSSSSSPSSGINSNSGPNNIRAPLASSHGGNNYPYAHYQLVIVGHSLGAAAAAILALMLRPHYPRLHCYAYGIPGCVLDQRSATESCEYITAGVCVSRSSMPITPSQYPSHFSISKLTFSVPLSTTTSPHHHITTTRQHDNTTQHNTTTQLQWS